LARFISSKLLALALGAVVLAGGFFATTGTVSADGPHGGYNQWDNDDKWDDHDKWDNWDKYDRCDKWDDNHHDDHDYWNSGNDNWDKHYTNEWVWWKKYHDDDCDDHDYHVRYIYSAPAITSGIPESVFYDAGLHGLIIDASTVFGITEQALYEKLYTGRTLADIGIDYKIGEANLQELLLALNPDLAPNIYAIVHQPWLLTSLIWIPV